VRFSLSNDGKSPLVFPPASSLRDRIASVFGTRVAAPLLAVEDVNGTTQVSGLVERPADVGTAGRRVHLTINGRAIRDLGIVRAAEAAYKSTIPSGVRPSLFLDVVVAADAVDVNVHPAKAEVRFRDPGLVRGLIIGGLRHALAAAGHRASTTVASAALGGFRPGGGWTPPPSAQGYSAWRQGGWQPSAQGALAAAVQSIPGLTEVSARAEPEWAPGAAEEGGPAPVFDPVDYPLGAARAQVHETYIVAQTRDGVVIVDQHAAHERLVYERMKAEMADGGVARQALLLP
jgi:DNA mismatch repair protein MutL